ncbi:hypothetical protein R0J89_18830, partial [Psychrobacter sp. SIMBA_152]
LVQLYGGVDAVFNTLSREVHALPVKAQLAVADNPLAAQLLAEYDCPVSLNPKESAQLLAQLPISAACLGTKTQKHCKAAGFRQLGE